MRSQEDALRSVAKFMADVLGPQWEVRFAVEQGTFKRPFCRVGFAGARPNPTGPAHTVEQTRPMIVHLYPLVPETPEQAHLDAARLEEQVDRAVMEGAGRQLPPTALTVVPVAGASGLAAGDYSYAVTAMARRGESAPVTAAPLTVVDGDAVHLSWQPSPGARGHNVYRDGLLIARTLEGSFVDDVAERRPGKELAVVDTSIVGGPRRIPLYDYEDVPLIAPARVRYWSDYLRVNDCSVGRVHDPEDERRVTVLIELRVAWRRTGARPEHRATLAASSSSGTGA